MDWQSPVAVAIAILCALWLVWQIARPFATGTLTACSGCTFCGVNGKDGAKDAELLQLEPLKAKE